MTVGLNPEKPPASMYQSAFTAVPSVSAKVLLTEVPTMSAMLTRARGFLSPAAVDDVRRYFTVKDLSAEEKSRLQASIEQSLSTDR